MQYVHIQVTYRCMSSAPPLGLLRMSLSKMGTLRTMLRLMVEMTSSRSQGAIRPSTSRSFWSCSLLWKEALT